MYPGDAIVLKRDCDAVQIPYGNSIRLPEGSEVSVMQQLGDSFTVMTSSGFLVRIDGKDAEALGREPPKVDGVAGGGEFSEERVWQVLKSCYDPEIPVNIVDLGLIYKCAAAPMEGGQRVDIQMTLTAPGCGMGQVLKDDIERKLAALPGVKEAHVDVVFDPPWDPSRMSEAARLQTGMM